MKAKAWLKYFVYLLLIIGVIKLKGLIEILFQNEYNKTYQFNHLLYAVIILTTVLVGVIIGLESFINETKKEGRWKVNLPKIVFVILPSLVVSLFYIIAMISNSFVNTVLLPVYNFFGSNDSFTTMFQLILGYSLITVMYKDAIKIEDTVGNNEPVNIENAVENYDSVIIENAVENNQSNERVMNYEENNSVNADGSEAAPETIAKTDSKIDE